MDIILDSKHIPQMVWHDDQPPFTIINKLGQPHIIVNFPCSHVFYNDGPNMIWNLRMSLNPMLMNRNVLWGFILTLPKFLAYQRPSNIKTLVKSWT